MRDGAGFSQTVLPSFLSRHTLTKAHRIPYLVNFSTGDPQKICGLGVVNSGHVTFLLFDYVIYTHVLRPRRWALFRILECALIGRGYGE